MATPPTSIIPSTSTPSSLSGGMTLEATKAQLERMDARLDTLSDELCQVNSRVGHIARQQVQMGGFVPFPSPSPKAFDEDDTDDKDKDANSYNNDEMTGSQ